MPHITLPEILRFLGGGVCHQMPGRSLQAGATTLPLCARCTGTYLGAVIGLLTVIVRGRMRASLLPRWPVLAAFGVFFLAWAADGLNSYLTLFPMLPHLYEPSNAARLVTGTLEGLALSLILSPVAAFTLWREPRAERVVSGRELALAALAAMVLAALLLAGWPGLLWGAGVVSALGLVGLFSLLNALLLAAALHREGSLGTGRQAALHLGLALLLATGELLLMSALRHHLLGA